MRQVLRVDAFMGLSAAEAFGLTGLTARWAARPRRPGTAGQTGRAKRVAHRALAAGRSVIEVGVLVKYSRASGRGLRDFVARAEGPLVSREDVVIMVSLDAWLAGRMRQLPGVH